MTVVFTAGTRFCVVLACDSAVAEEMEDGQRSYGTGRKWYTMPGVGAVTTWGARDGNRISERMTDLQSSGNVSSLDQLANDIFSYLRNDFRPHESGSGRVGFHIGGFLPDRTPRVYHAFWDPSLGPTLEDKYQLQVNNPANGLFMQYNGRDDLAEAVLTSTLREIQAKRTLPLDLRTGAGLVGLGHLILRFARELTYDVGPPFFAIAIGPDNTMFQVQLPEWLPLNDQGFINSARFLQNIDPFVDVIRLSP